MAATGKLTIVVDMDARTAISGFSSVGQAVNKFGTESKKGFDTAAAGAERFQKSVGGLGNDKGMRAMAGATANVTAQLNDIFVVAAAGQNIFTTMIQQGSQMAAVWAVSGNVFQTMGASIKAMLSPVSLLTFGFVGIAAAVVQWGVSLFDTSKATENMFKEHDKALKDLIALYPQAGDAAEKFGLKAREAMAKVAAGKDKEALAGALEGQIVAASTKINEIMAKNVNPELAGLTGEQLATALVTGFSTKLGEEFSTDTLKAFAEPIAQITTELAAGNPDFAAFNENVTKTGQALSVTQPILSLAAADLQTLTESYIRTNAAIVPFIPVLDAWNASVAAGHPDVVGLAEGIAQVMKNNPSPMFQEMGRALVTAAEEAINTALALGQTSAALNTTTAAAQATAVAVHSAAAAMRSGAIAADAYTAAMGRLRAASAAPLSDFQAIEKDHQAAVTAARGNKELIDEARAQRDAAIKALPEVGPSEREHNVWLAEQNQLLIDNKNALLDSAEPQRVFNREVAKLDALMAQGTITQKEYNTARAELSKQTFPAAKKGGGAKTEAEKELAALEKFSEKMKDSLDPTREFRRAVEELDAAIAAGAFPMELRAQAVAQLAKQHRGAATETFNLAKTMGDMMKQWGNQVASSLADAIVEGENLEDVFKGLIKQLAKMAIEMLVLKPLMESMSSGFSGLGGGGGGISIPLTAPATTAPVQGIARSGRVSTSAASSGSAGNVVSTSMGNLIVNMGDSPGGVKSDSEQGKAFGKRVRDIIQAEIVAQSRPGGLLSGGR